MTDNWEFSHNKATDAVWTPGLREIFEYRDLGFKDSSKGDYVAHIVKANGKEMTDEVQHWHVHDCTFQFVMVLNGWAEFEYEGIGVRRIEKGDCINQRPALRIARSAARRISRCLRSSLRRISRPGWLTHQLLRPLNRDVV